MLLAWLRKKLPNRDGETAHQPDAPAGTPDAGEGDLRFSEAPPLLDDLFAASDYERALEVIQDDRSSGDAPGELESAYWEIVCLIELGRLDEALQAAEAVIDRHPDSADLYLAQAYALRQTGKANECLEALSMALHYAPASTKILNMIGELSQQQKDLDAAIEYFRKSIEYELSAGTVNMLAKALSEAGRFHESEEVIRQALDRFPEHPGLLGNLGRVLMVTDHYEEAIAIQQKLADLPDVDIQLYKDLTYVHYCLGELDQAKYYLRKILSIEPSNYDAHFYLGLIQLAVGDFAEAWDHYRWRFHASMKHGRHYAFPEWDGTPSTESTLLIFAEQGLGDEIMFSGCVPDVLAQDQKVLLECEERLAELFSRSFPKARIVPWAKNKKANWIKEAGPIDRQIAIGDLPGLYRRSMDAFPDHRGYLKPDPDKVARWRERLETLGGARSFGISWRGGTVNSRRSIRSIGPSDWGALIALPNTNFISLQYGDVQDDLTAFSATHGLTVHHWQEAIDDYDETAALVAALDGVATVCTAIAHLTGALGQIGWVATPVIPEWRYMTGGDRWLWYPQMRLIRQDTLGDWSDVMETIARQVSEHCRGGVS